LNLSSPRIKKKNRLLRLLTHKRIAGITLAPFGIYFREDMYEKQNAVLLNHERIHWRQQLELLIVFFHILYLGEWLIRLITNPGNAYRSISFEREAYANDDKPDYLEKRRPYAWVKYLFK
jgi:hypothetical protein